MSFLEDKIRAASQKYYSGEKPDMTDDEFDDSLNKLAQENPNSELLTAIGHGYNVELDSTAGKKFKHKYGVAGSLDKVYTWKDFNDALSSNVMVHASLKLDGLSVVLYYEDGKLVQALTRGDGVTGIDITSVIYAILSDRDKMLKDREFTGAVRGEILMSNADFESFKQIHPEAKNSRNSAAGLINSNKIVSDLKFLHVRVYTVVGIETSKYLSADRITRNNIQEWLQDNFTNIAPFEYIWYDESDYVSKMNYLKSKWYALGIPADGIVLSDIDVEIRSSDIGDRTQFEIVYNSQAFKFPSETAEVTVSNVEWNLTKNRRLMPTVIFNPVELAGTTVQRATGYNAKYIKDNYIGIGAIVEVEKHGEIIPNINRVISAALGVLIPSTCPCCGEPLEWIGVDLMCNNIKCSNAMEQDTLMWFKHLVPTDGMGDILILKFCYDMLGDDISIERIMDSPSPHRLVQSGVQTELFNQMLERLYTDRFKLRDALEALNIPRLGNVTSSKLADSPDIVKEVLNCESYEDANRIISKVLGKADSGSICDNLEKFKRLQFIEDRIDWNSDSSLNQNFIKVAVTGKLSMPRAQFEARLLKKGYKVCDISKDTKYLITNDPNSNSSKNAKADKLGIPKITELEFVVRFIDV